MTNEEVNKIIAEFMGWRIATDGSEDFFYLDRRWESNIYTESLDALVPVWEKLCPKLDFMTGIYIEPEINGYLHEVGFYDDGGFGIERCLSVKYKTIQEAAARATVKVILGIRENTK